MRPFLLLGWCIGAQLITATNVETKVDLPRKGQSESIHYRRTISYPDAKPPAPASGKVYAGTDGSSPIGEAKSVTATSSAAAWNFSLTLFPVAHLSGLSPLFPFGIVASCASGGAGYTPPPMIWTMINVCPGQGQADCHLLEFPNGMHVLIDAAEGWDAKGAALDYLQKAGIKHIELVVLSHVHWDHYGKLIDIINSGIKVDRVAVSMPASREIADAEIPWGCNWDDVQAMLQFLRKRDIPYWTPQFGERLVDVTRDGVRSVLEVVCHFDGISTPVGRTDINDTSMLVRLRHGAIKVLFTGDLNNPLGTWLAMGAFDLKADLLKVPHHGTEGLAPNIFFDRVAPKAAFVPSPKDLWYSDRSKRTREYFANHNIPTYVSGVDGTVKVVMTGDKYEITTSNTPVP